jgi:hypothetical protein
MSDETNNPETGTDTPAPAPRTLGDMMRDARPDQFPALADAVRMTIELGIGIEHSVKDVRLRAAISRAENAIESDNNAAARREKRVAELRLKLQSELKEILDLSSADVSPGTFEISSGDDEYTSIFVTVDGLRFTLRNTPYADSYRDYDRLHVLLPCPRPGCRRLDELVAVHVTGVWDIATALAEGGPWHHTDCTVERDEEGNPIHPPKPPKLTAADVADLEMRVAISDIEKDGDEKGAAYDLVAELEDQRPLVKADAIRRLMETGKATSATAAEKVVELDADYMDHRAKQRAAEIERHRMNARFESAIANAHYRVERLRHVNRLDEIERSGGNG